MQRSQAQCSPEAAKMAGRLDEMADGSLRDWKKTGLSNLDSEALHFVYLVAKLSFFIAIVC